MKKFYFLLLIAVVFSTALRAQIIQITDNTSRITTVNNNIYRYFYDSTRHLFYEKAPRKKTDKRYSFLWPLCALIQAANEMEVLDSLTPQLPKVTQAIEAYYDTRLSHPGYDSYILAGGGGDRFYDDNQWIGIAYMDAYKRNQDRRYLETSKEIYDFMLTGYDDKAGGGLYWREFDQTTKNTCSNGPGVLLALQLYNTFNDKKYLDTAILLFDWVEKTLASPQGVYYDAIKIPQGTIDTSKYTYNAGTMLQSAIILFKLTRQEQYISTAKKIARSSLAVFYKNGMFPENYWFNAVLLRGYIELYKLDGDKTYLNAFAGYLEKVWQSQRDFNSLIGTKSEKTLLDQAGYLEMLCRIENFRRNPLALRMQ